MAKYGKVLANKIFEYSYFWAWNRFDEKTILIFIFVFVPFFLSSMFIVERRNRLEYEKCTLALEEDCITESFTSLLTSILAGGGDRKITWHTCISLWSIWQLSFKKQLRKEGVIKSTFFFIINDFRFYL